MSVGPIRVAIVDDHPIFRFGLAAYIGEMEAIDLVGEAERAGDVADLLTATSPDVLLLDVRLPDGNGLDVNRSLRETHPAVKVVMLTMSEEIDTARTALRDGAKGYLVKGALPETVENAIRLAAAGAMPVDQKVMDGLITPDRAPAGLGADQYPFPELTTRERDVLDGIARGLNNAAVARTTYLNEKTVRNYITSIKNKLHADDRPSLIVLARQNGLGGASDSDGSA
jgi:DNA-binding NarL/FixJ family response regulator